VRELRKAGGTERRYGGGQNDYCGKILSMLIDKRDKEKLNDHLCAHCWSKFLENVLAVGLEFCRTGKLLRRGQHK
jgi:hypothetical protein